MNSVRSITTDRGASDRNRTVFVCGFVAKRWHNSSLLAVIQDLLPEYYVACNADTWEENSVTRLLLTNAEAMLFFVNEFTLANRNCLMNLQYAWHLMVPVIVIRPPRTKLVICKREQFSANTVIVENGSIVRGPSSRWSLLEDPPTDTIDYALLQDVLREGYKQSLVYDRHDHRSSMMKISEKLRQIMEPTLRGPRMTPAFYLSPSDELELTESEYHNEEITTERDEQKYSDSADHHFRVSQSLGNLDEKVKRSFPRTPLPDTNQKFFGMFNKEMEEASERPSTETNKKEENHIIPPLSTTDSIRNPPSTLSRSSSLEQRMSLGSFDDINSFQETQYLVFPIRNTSTKPKLIKFPEDLMEEEVDKNDSIWGSDTSLEEDSEMAVKINGGIIIDGEGEESPIGSPAPYIEDL